MSIRDTLNLVENIASSYNIDKPYIVGGLPRDMYLNQEVATTDVDITTNSSEVMLLGILVAEHLNVPFELSDDGHITVYADELDLDFSSNFISDRVLEYLNEEGKGFEEAYSRDFTINTLHKELSSNTFFDPTGMAIDDIKNKIIRTPVPPSITLKDDPRRIYRAVNLAVRYGFDIDDEIINFVKENKDMFSSENIKDKYITVKINKALDINPDLTISLLKKLDLFDYIPLVSKFKEVLMEKKILLDYLDNKTAQHVVYNWKEYSKQSKAHKDLSDWWKAHYLAFEGYDSPSFSSWSKWYMDNYRGDWNRKHKSPEETLQIMKEEAMGGGEHIHNKDEQKKEEKYDTMKITKHPASGTVQKGSGVDIDNVSNDVKNFISVLGNVAKEINVETPYITSGYRSPLKQTSLMLSNWLANGGMNGGREYLISIYNDQYANKIADIFERYGNTKRSIDMALPIVNKYGSRHMRKPAQAIDLRNTAGIVDVLDKIKKSQRFDMKIVDETNTEGPHWHIVIYNDKGSSARIASILNRKEVLSKIAANIHK